MVHKTFRVSAAMYNSAPKRLALQFQQSYETLQNIHKGIRVMFHSLSNFKARPTEFELEPYHLCRCVCEIVPVKSRDKRRHMKIEPRRER